MSALWGCFRIEQTMKMHDEVAHLCTIHGLLRLCPPRNVRLGVVRIQANDVDLVEIFEFDISDLGQLAAKYEMQQLFGLSFATHL